jgi:DNA-binding PadR family transcriptional regulator
MRKGGDKVPKRRKVGNMLALAILSTLTQRPMHPYEMASVMRVRGKDQDMPIKWGSLYTVVQNLERHGFIQSTGSVRQGARPERTTYAITPAGREELADWVRELLAETGHEQPRFEAGLSVMGAIGPDEAIELLRLRIDRLEAYMTRRRAEVAAASDVPRIFLIEVEYDLAIQQAEADWIRGLLAEIDAGEFPGIDMWREFYETGELPPELRDMSERGAMPASE